MKSRFWIAFSLLALGLLAACSCGRTGTKPTAAAQTLGLIPVADVALPGSSSRLDYQSLDEQAHHLYIAHLCDR
jgi:hypothetical protein